MGIWCIITTALAVFSIGAVWYWQGKYRERELSEISSMLECIPDGRSFQSGGLIRRRCYRRSPTSFSGCRA